MAEMTDPSLRLAAASASIASYCDRAEHLELTDPTMIRTAGATLREVAVELAIERDISIVQAYRMRLHAVEQRHPLYPADGFAAVEAIPEHNARWRELQQVQWQHDRHYHPDVLGLSRYEQLRHYAFHLAKLAGSAAQATTGDDHDFYARRLPDILLFGLKLATLVNEQLTTESVQDASKGRGD